MIGRSWYIRIYLSIEYANHSLFPELLDPNIFRVAWFHNFSSHLCSLKKSSTPVQRVSPCSPAERMKVHQGRAESRGQRSGFSDRSFIPPVSTRLVHTHTHSHVSQSQGLHSGLSFTHPEMSDPEINLVLTDQETQTLLSSFRGKLSDKCFASGLFNKAEPINYS